MTTSPDAERSQRTGKVRRSPMIRSPTHFHAAPSTSSRRLGPDSDGRGNHSHVAARRPARSAFGQSTAFSSCSRTPTIRERPPQRFLLSRRILRFVHNGSRVMLRHVAPIVMPYLTTKDDEPDTIGRFGIGLKTLSALGTTLDVHCAPYHFTADSDGPHAAKAHRPIEGLYRPDGRSTLFVLRLHRGALTPRMLDAWLDELGVPGIVFLSHLRTLKVVAGRYSRELRSAGGRRSLTAQSVGAHRSRRYD